MNCSALDRIVNAVLYAADEIEPLTEDSLCAKS
jgi:hypothetical protein